MGKRTNTARWNDKRNRWEIKVQQDGVRKMFTSSTPGRTGQREANAKADAWLDDGIQTGRTTLSKLFPAYLEALKLRSGRSHWERIESRWRNWEEPVLGRMRPDALSDQKLQEVVDRAYAKGHLARETLRNIRRDVVSYAKYLRKAKYTTYRPEEIIVPKGAHVGQRNILQPQDLVTLFTVDTTEYQGKPCRDAYINAYRFQVLTGLRPGELLGLMPGDVEGDRVTIRRAINVHREITHGKNDNAGRTFVLTPTARAVLEDQLQRMDGIYIFGAVGEPAYRRRWKRYCEVNGIPYVTPYELRHTFVSAVQGLPEGWVKTLVGHSRAMDTFGVYGHEMAGQQQRIAAGVEAVFRDILAEAT